LSAPHQLVRGQGRDFARVLAALPPMDGKTILDLGCGAGDEAELLAARGARVIGLDMNDALLAEARARNIPNAEFFNVDLRVPSAPAPADGLWCSFAAAYFIDLSAVLATWKRLIVPGGWIALTEIDDLFGHAPLRKRAREKLEAYTRDALAARRYDFYMGRKLAGHLERAGFTVDAVLELDDRELAFSGRAEPDVVEKWRARFERMHLLRAFCGAEFERVRDDFLACLKRADHRTVGRVVGAIGKA
jgi:trans-aconitate methyltransferase